MADIDPYPLYNRSYLLYRVSPLHHADASLLDEHALHPHAKRLREQLKGDNVRGVEVDFAATEGALPNLGPLEECVWEVVGDEDAWIDRQRQFTDPDASQFTAVSAEHARGIEVTLQYEKQSYNALLLRDPKVTASPEGFTSLPLLLIRMPSMIRQVFLDYLRTAFDAHVAPLRLSSAFVTSSLETYFRHFSADSSGQYLQDAIRQLQVQLSFPNATTLLRSIDVTIAGRHVSGFLDRGKLLQDKNAKERPFTAALSAYIKKHLALDLSHPKVHVSRISCATFTLGADRLKLMAPDIPDELSIDDSSAPEMSAGQRAVEEVYRALVREATGTGKFLAEEFALADGRLSTPSSSESTGPGRRKRAVSSAAATSRTTKRSKAREVGKGGNKPGDEDMADA